MTDVFPALAARFSAKRPGVVVTAIAGPSVPQTKTLIGGSGIDVFVSPDEETMAVVGRARAVRGVRTFAETDMVLLVAPGNPLQIEGVEALGDERVRSALCVVTEACGRAASRILEHSGIDAARVIEAPEVRTTANRVVDGIADVAIVERTEALRLGSKASVVEVGEDVNEIGAYQTAVASRSKNGALASAFVAFLAGREARAELLRAGFNPPAA